MPDSLHCSFVIPPTDDALDVDSVRREVRFYKGAWGRESSNIADEIHAFDELLADPARLARLKNLLHASDAPKFAALIA